MPWGAAAFAPQRRSPHPLTNEMEELEVSWIWIMVCWHSEILEFGVLETERMQLRPAPGRCLRIVQIGQTDLSLRER
jgi:hypothetical protein